MWCFANVVGIGDMMFKGNPNNAVDGVFEVEKPTHVIVNPKAGLGFMRWVGAALTGAKIGAMNRSALAVWFPMTDNEIIKACEDAWTDKKGPGIQIPTAKETMLITNGKPFKAV